MDCRASTKGGFSSQMMQTTEDMTLSMSLMLLPPGNITKPFCEWIFLFGQNTLHSQIWTVLCGLQKPRVNEYIQRPLEISRQGNTFGPLLHLV